MREEELKETLEVRYVTAEEVEHLNNSDGGGPFKVISHSLINKCQWESDGEDPITCEIEVALKGIWGHYSGKAEGEGTVHAGVSALREALIPHFPYLQYLKAIILHIQTFKGAIEGKVTVALAFEIGNDKWATSATHTDVLRAALEAYRLGVQWYIHLMAN